MYNKIKQRIARLKKQIMEEPEKSKKEDLLNDFMGEMSTRTIGTGHRWGTVKYLDGDTNEGESSSRLSSLSRCLHEEFGVSGVEGCLSGDQNRDMYDDSSYDLCFGFNKKFVTPKKGYYESAISLTYIDRQLIINVSSYKENEIEEVNKSKEAYRANIVMGIGGGNASRKQPSEIPKRFGLAKDKARSIKMSPVFENTLSKYNTDLLQVINAAKDSKNTVVCNKSFKDRLKITNNNPQNNKRNNFSIIKNKLTPTIDRLKGYWFKGGNEEEITRKSS